jgi:hypothetical protein
MSSTRTNPPSLESIRDAANVKIFKSINKRGLCSLKHIPMEEVLVNPVLQSRAIDGMICVNYANLKDASAEELNTIFKTLTYEEYTGIYGIAAERQSPFQQFNNANLFQAELTERLMSSLVFILSAPFMGSRTYPKSSHLIAQTILRPYGSDDSYSQLRGELLIKDKVAPSNRITEIKTSFKFDYNFVFSAVLIPEHLFTIAKSLLSNWQIPFISVPSGQVTLTRIPAILQKLHGEKMPANSHVNVIAPLYHDSLREYFKDSDSSEFSLHVVRLQTSYDFMLRTISNNFTKETDQLLKKIQAETIVKSEQEAIIAVHKRFGVTRLARLKALDDIPLETKRKIVDSNTENEVIYLHLKGLAKRSMIYIYSLLSKSQQNRLIEKYAVLITPIRNDSLAITFSRNQNIKNIMKETETIKTQAATKIQRQFRLFSTKKDYLDYKAKKAAYLQAEARCLRRI